MILVGDDDSAEFGEHVRERRVGSSRGTTARGARRSATSSGLMAVQRVPADGECHRQELERDGPLYGFLGARLGVADAGLVLGFFEEHLLIAQRSE